MIQLHIGERIKKVRKELNLTQTEFAAQIGLTQNTVTRYETGDRRPSAAVLALVSQTYHVNDVWLRTGEGEMFVQRLRTDELSSFIDSLLQSEPDDIRRRFVTAMSRLSTKELEILEKTALHLADKLSAAAPAVTPERTTPDTDGQEQAVSDILAELTELKRQNQKLAAKIAAMEEEDIANGLLDGSASHSESAGTFSPRAKK